jgi:hypothetical protein
VTKQEALILLGADENNFEDAVLISIFEHKQFILKSVITPQVFKTRARKITTLNEALKFLKNEEVIEHPNNTNFDCIQLLNLNVQNLLLFYRNYERIMSEIKLKFMQNNDPGIVSASCLALSELEHLKLITIASATSDLTINSLIEVKISEFVNSGEIIKELKNIDHLAVTNENLTLLPTFSKDICRSRKYANFTQLKNLKNA